MISMKRILLSILLTLSTPAFSQWQVPDHSIPIGRGTGTGFKNVLCITGQVLQFNTGADPTCITNPISGLANPTASVGLTTINGTATTGMRSDAAPPLSASVQAALTGTNHYVLLGTGTFGVNSVSPTTSGWVLTSNGTSADPSFQAPPVAMATISCDLTTVASSSVTIASSSPNLTVVGASYVSGDVGKVIRVPSAGTTVSGIAGTLITTILSVTDGTHIVLNANASTTLSGVAKTIIYGTDKTSALQTLINNNANGIITIPKCMTTDTITVPSPIYIFGNGVTSSAVYFSQLAGTAVKPAFSQSADNFILKQVLIDADAGGNITSTTGTYAIESNNHSIIIDGVECNANRSAQVKPALGCIGDFGSWSRIHNAYIHDISWYPLRAYGAASHVWITDTTVVRGPDGSAASCAVCFLSNGITSTTMGDLHIVNLTVDVSDSTTALATTALFIYGGDATTHAYTSVTLTNPNFIGPLGTTSSGIAGFANFNTRGVTVNGGSISYFGEGIGNAATTDTSITGITLKGNGTYGIESNTDANLAVSGVVIDADIYSLVGIVLENCLTCTVTGNTIAGASAPVAFAPITSNVTNSGGPFLSRITIVGNTIKLPDAATGKGILLDCSFGTCVDATIQGNTIRGGTTGSIGIAIYKHAGTTWSGLLIGPNNTSQATGTFIDSGLTSLCYLVGNFVGGGTALTNNSTSTCN